MKGADQCPRCGSRKTKDVSQAVTDFYARTIRVCGNCRTAWEPFDPAETWDKTDRACSFKHPCNNCAFRKDSPEHADPIGWQGLIDKLGWWDGHFYCHKGVPITPGEGFAYPQGKDGKPNVKKLRLCRGYLNWLGGLKPRARLAMQIAARSAGA